MRFGCRSRYISRYASLKFEFLPCVVASIVAMVFLRRICSSRPGDGGNSADRAWQLSQLVEGVLTAFNLSHGSLSCVKTNSVRVSQPAVLSALLVIQLFGIMIPPPHLSPKEHQKERCGHSRPQRSFITFYGALRNILLSTGFSAVFPRIASNFVLVNITFELFFLRDKLNWP